jgi:hypothetical protein
MPRISTGDGTYTGKVISGVEVSSRNGKPFEYFSLSAKDEAPLSENQPLLTVTCQLSGDTEEAPKIGSFVTVEIHGREEVSNNGFRDVKSAIGVVTGIKPAAAKAYDPSMWKMREVVNDGQLRKFTPRQRLLTQNTAN